MRDLAIVGLGLIGSAALRHSAATNADVIGIGTAEPVDWAHHDGPFASHYDCGRVTRSIDARIEWSTLAMRAIEQYPIIEAASGTKFHRPSGVVFVRNDPDGIERVTTVAEQQGLDIIVDTVEVALQNQPELTFPSGWTAICEPGPAGAIDPRAMAAAQLSAASNAGATVERDTVTNIEPTREGFEVLTAGGETHHARDVLIAAGAYSGQFLAQPPAIAVRPESIVLGEISAEQAQALEHMPSVLYLLDHPALDDTYIVPPALYPDGKWYLKIGGSGRSMPTLPDAEAMNEWMRSNRADDDLTALKGVMTNVLTNVEFLSWHAKPCLITDTASGLPYIDRVDGMTVAFAGNGHAAKSSDAIGALGAALALGGSWPDSILHAAAFALRLGTYQPPTGSRHGS